MKKSYIVLIVVIILAIFTGSWIVGTYNSFISQNENIDAQWANVETNYQRRFDLIPNLVTATKSILKQEQKVFGDIAEARTRYAGTAPNSSERVDASSGLESALGRLLMIIENYPDLKSNQTVASLMDELAGSENRISVERIRYNEVVRAYNITIKRFPRKLIANMWDFNERDLFEAVEESNEVPTINLDLE